MFILSFISLIIFIKRRKWDRERWYFIGSLILSLTYLCHSLFFNPPLCVFNKRNNIYIIVKELINCLNAMAKYEKKKRSRREKQKMRNFSKYKILVLWWYFCTLVLCRVQAKAKSCTRQAWRGEKCDRCKVQEFFPVQFSTKVPKYHQSTKNLYLEKFLVFCFSLLLLFFFSHTSPLHT